MTGSGSDCAVPRGTDCMKHSDNGEAAVSEYADQTKEREEGLKA